MKKILFFLVPILLISCSIFSPEPTLIPSPIPTPTLDISSIVLDSILFQAGDLPAGYQPTQITYSGIPFLGSNNNLAINWVHQDISYKDEDIGGVTLGISDSDGDSFQLFEILTESLGENHNQSEVFTKRGSSISTNGTEIEFSSMNVGFSEYNLPNIKNIALVFHKCKFSGYIVLSGTDDPQEMINYIERLSRRLSELLSCK